MSRKEELEKHFDKNLILMFKKEVNDNSAEIDENNEYDWFALTLGWGIAKGLSPDDAHIFAIYIRYYTELG